MNVMVLGTQPNSFLHNVVTNGLMKSSPQYVDSAGEATDFESETQPERNQ